MNNKEPLSLSPSEMEPASAYKLFQSLVAPRPIAWVSSIDTRGRVNLAPFSFFNAIATKPLIVMLAIGRKGGLPKDTLRNIEETGEFVINIVSEELAEAGLEEWARSLPAESASDLVDLEGGRAVRWVTGVGWVDAAGPS